MEPDVVNVSQNDTRGGDGDVEKGPRPRVVQVGQGLDPKGAFEVLLPTPAGRCEANGLDGEGDGEEDDVGQHDIGESRHALDVALAVGGCGRLGGHRDAWTLFAHGSQQNIWF